MTSSLALAAFVLCDKDCGRFTRVWRKSHCALILFVACAIIWVCGYRGVSVKKLLSQAAISGAALAGQSTLTTSSERRTST